jgi:hypothetical protein
VEKSCIDKSKSQSLIIRASAGKESENTSFEFLSDDETKLITSTTTVQASHDIRDEHSEEVTLLPYDYALVDPARYHHPEHLLAPVVHIKPPTPTTPVAPGTPTPHTSCTSTTHMVFTARSGSLTLSLCNVYDKLTYHHDCNNRDGGRLQTMSLYSPS